MVFEVVPGRSIGPFKLGMTSADVAETGIQPEAFKIHLWFNAEGVCERISILATTSANVVIFGEKIAPFGEVDGGLNKHETMALLDSKLGVGRHTPRGGSEWPKISAGFFDKISTGEFFDIDVRDPHSA